MHSASLSGRGAKAGGARSFSRIHLAAIDFLWDELFAAIETPKRMLQGMADRALELTPVTAAGQDGRGCWHVYYRRHYVGFIGPYRDGWTARLHDISLGQFETLDHAKREVETWYYGPAIRECS